MSKKVPLERLRDISKQRSVRRTVLAQRPSDPTEASADPQQVIRAKLPLDD